MYLKTMLDCKVFWQNVQRKTITGLMKSNKFVSNLLFMKQNLADSIILPPKNGGLSVRKANLT